MTTFKDLNIIAPILDAVNDLGYKNPTPIQQQTIPVALQGKDVLGCAQTGTGKTAAFAIPILQLLDSKKPSTGKKVIRSLILTPTRELAIQIEDSFKDYGKYLGIKHTVIFGGVNQNSQVNELRKGVDILVATPGRLLDLIGQRLLSIRDIEIFVLDEADRMLDMGFVHDVRRVLGLIPERRQTLFFSATMPKAIQSLADSMLTRPTKVEVTPESTTAETIRQTLYYIEKENKQQALLRLLGAEVDDSVLVFMRTKHRADRMVKFLAKHKISAAALHGDKSQNARQRALESFKNKSIKVLVATDIAARGIDIDLLKYVINFEIPNIPESYVHRIGRSGRAGAEGFAISLCAIDEIAYIKDIQDTIGIDIPVGIMEGLSMPAELISRPQIKQKLDNNGARPPRPNGGKPDYRHKKKNDRSRSGHHRGK